MITQYLDKLIIFLAQRPKVMRMGVAKLMDLLLIAGKYPEETREVVRYTLTNPTPEDITEGQLDLAFRGAEFIKAVQNDTFEEEVPTAVERKSTIPPTK